MDNNKAVDLVYLDFQKAFDKVPHERLMVKVNAHGIQGDAARWIRNWLAGRRQRVCINQSYSNWAPVTSGVPQGSVLGLLLFLIIIIIKRDWQCKAGRERSTPYQSEDPNPTIPTLERKKRKGKQ